MKVPSPVVILSGMLAADPGQGGATWAVLNYYFGLRALGCDVHLIEPITPNSLKARGESLSESESGLYFRAIVEHFGLEGRATLLDPARGVTLGASFRELLELSRRADVLINIAGMLKEEGILQNVPIRAYLDLDPAFTQLWQESEGIDMRFAGHTHFVTVGLGIGRPECIVPTCGFDWIHTFPPVSLDHWTPGSRILCDGLTTVANWRGYGSITRDGLQFGQKAHSLRSLVDLPNRTDEPFFLALAIHPGEQADVAALNANGWTLLDPSEVAGTPERYQNFVRGSRAEFGLAKSGYVVSRSGWFSDRSACYLASGRPVIAQDTGFGTELPTGEGLFAFTTPDDVLYAIDELRSDYERHSRAARDLAEQRLDSRKVMRVLLQRLGV